MESGTLDLQAINAKLGLTPDSDTLGSGKTNINDKDIDQLKQIMASGSPSGINPDNKSADKDAKIDFPEYLNDFKELLDKKFEKPEEDKTDYSQRAIHELGTNFSHYNTKESFESELFMRNAQQQYIQDNPVILQLNDVINGAYTPRQIINEHMRHGLDKDDPEYDDKLSARVDQFFTADGELNAKGNTRYSELIESYKNSMQQHIGDAKKYASDELKKHNEFKITLTSELANYKFGGVKLSDDLREHIQHIILSGKSKEFLEATPATPKEAAEREIKLAILADPKAFAEIIKALDDRGIDYGQKLKAMKYFNNKN